MRILFFILLFFTCYSVQAQVVYKETEYGFGAGASNYYGDLNQTQNFKNISYSASGFYKYNFNDYIAIKGCLNHAQIKGNDKTNTNTFEKLRNLDFTNQITELSVQGEFNFLKYTIGDFDKRITPYMNIGFGAFYHSPFTYLNDRKYFLKPLGTEGQNFVGYEDRKYSNINISLPVGLGVKFWVNKGITAGFEVLNRFTSSDYLDDVSTTYVGADKYITIPGLPNIEKQLQDRSTEVGTTALGVAGRQRGVASDKDQFLTAQVTLSIRFQEYRCPRYKN
jgi:hypothetical protein